MTRRTRALLAAPALCAALALSLAACGTKDEPASNSGGSSSSGGTSQGTTVTTGKTTATTAKTTGTTTKATGTSTPAGPVAIKTATTQSLGEVLVDADGMTLYVFEKDTPSAIACVDKCTVAWPPLVGTAAQPGTGVTATSFATVTRPDGATQITVDGKPLYRFSGDTKPGDTNGQKINDSWYVVNAAGQAVE